MNYEMASDWRPAQQIEPIDVHQGRWRATGDDPFFIAAGPVPKGWNHIRFQITSEEIGSVTPTLYFDEGYGFEAESRAELKVFDGAVDEPIYISARVQALRLDPIEQAGTFHLGPITIEPLLQSEIAALGEGVLATRRIPYESRQIQLLAGQDVQISKDDDAQWQSLGDDPSFLFRFRRKRYLPAGKWTRVQIQIIPLKGTKLYPSLYIDDGVGYNENTRQFLRWRDGYIDDVVFLPKSTRGLRFDPLDGRGAFRIGPVSVRGVSRLTAWRVLAEKIWATLEHEERRPAALLVAARDLLRRHSLRELGALALRRATRPPIEGSYAAWIEAVERPGIESADAMAAAIAGFRTKPVFSIVVPVYETPKEWLVAAIESVRAQAYPHWQLCLCDDASPSSHVRETLARYATADPRITVVTRRENGHISRATNDALAAATGTHMVLMDHDDLIPPHALYEFARVIDAEPDVDFIYSDEDKITVGGQRYAPFFKPDWSPDTLEGCMYTAHLACYAMGIVREVGGFRPECDGAQDYDFVLRFTERARTVRHVPKILYHWRAIPGSTAAEMANKGYVLDAAVRGLTARAERTGMVDIARPSVFAGAFELRRAIVGRPLVSVVIPTAGRDVEIRGRTVDLLQNCLDSVSETSTYDNIELIVVDNGDLRPETFYAVRRHGARSVTFAVPEFNVAAKMNLGAREARGELILFLNDDIEVITPDWLESLIAAVQVPGVGIAGPKLHFEDGTLQNVGVTFHDSMPDEIRRGYPEKDPGYAYSSVARRNYMALTGACLMIPRSVFEEVGGFDENLKVNYNDVDLCLQAWSRGYRVVFEPLARLYHFESRSRTRTVDPAQAAIFRTRWSETLRRDPYYPEWLQTRPPTFELDPTRF